MTWTRMSSASLKKITYSRSVKGSTDLGGSERKSHVSGVSSGNGVHGKTTGLVSGLCKGGSGVDISGSAHLHSGL